MNARFALLAAAAVGFSFVASAHAAIVTFGTATTVSGDTDVYNPSGATVVNATNIDGAADLINGVQFTPLAGNGIDNSGPTPVNVGITQGDLHLSNPNGFSDAGGAYASNATPFSGLSTVYKDLLSTGHYVDNNGTVTTATFSNLTVGVAYHVELFVNDARTCCSNNTRNESVTSPDLGSIAATLGPYNNTGVDGGRGAFILGDFVADSTSQVVTITSDHYQLNAITLISTPEPASLGILGIAGLGLLARRRRA